MKIKIVSILLCSIMIIILIGCGNVNNTVDSTTNKNQADSLTPEQQKYVSLLESGKEYTKLSADEKKVLLEILISWDTQDDNFKYKYGKAKELLENQRITELKKQEEENKIKYADLIKEIQGIFPDMKISSISGDLDNEKTMVINMNLLKSIDSTKSTCAELLVKKETALKNAGISKINIFIDNQGNNVGLLFFELENGEYKTTISNWK